MMVLASDNDKNSDDDFLKHIPSTWLEVEQPVIPASQNIYVPTSTIPDDYEIFKA